MLDSIKGSVAGLGAGFLTVAAGVIIQEVAHLTSNPDEDTLASLLKEASKLFSQKQEKEMEMMTFVSKPVQ